MLLTGLTLTLSGPSAVRSYAVRDRSRPSHMYDALRGPGRTLRPFTEETVFNEASPAGGEQLDRSRHVPRSLTQSVRRFISGVKDDLGPVGIGGVCI